MFVRRGVGKKTTFGQIQGFSGIISTLVSRTSLPPLGAISRWKLSCSPNVITVSELIYSFMFNETQSNLTVASLLSGLCWVIYFSFNTFLTDSKTADPKIY